MSAQLPPASQPKPIARTASTEMSDTLLFLLGVATTALAPSDVNCGLFLREVRTSES